MHNFIFLISSIIWHICVQFDFNWLHNFLKSSLSRLFFSISLDSKKSSEHSILRLWHFFPDILCILHRWFVDSFYIRRIWRKKTCHSHKIEYTIFLSSKIQGTEKMNPEIKRRKKIFHQNQEKTDIRFYLEIVIVVFGDSCVYSCWIMIIIHWSYIWRFPKKSRSHL